MDLLAYETAEMEVTHIGDVCDNAASSSGCVNVAPGDSVVWNLEQHSVNYA